ncbi:hypothetical protein D6764_00845 [Candidatus Woesearchaeota archaeon]|nr:MAG: hypothetical protein D6764_00845 [Candidatus Woesearchaeota archaeon]
MKLTLEEIKKIDDPEERLRLLKEFEKQVEEELREAAKLEKEQIKELERKRKLEGVAVPEQEPVNLEQLFGQEQEEDKNLEERTGMIVADSTGIQYRLEKDLETLQAFVNYRTLNEEQKQEVAKIEGTISAFKYINPSKEVAEKLTASMGLLEQIKKYTMG